jgi:peptide-methionine (S)-S-oxide reductase
MKTPAARWTASIALAVGVAAIAGGIFMTGSSTPRPAVTADMLAAAQAQDGLERATFGTGCFWCTEAVFQQLKGVATVASGYSGGHVKDPTYRDVCSGETGHAEVLQVAFDPKLITYPELLEVFWQTHDPTTLNRQGNDVGPQYRSAIFYHSEEQRELAEHYKRKLDESKAFPASIVTQLAPFTVFYPAEEYHQNYYLDNPGQSYCSFVIRPKVEKFRKAFADKLKPGS